MPAVYKKGNPRLIRHRKKKWRSPLFWLSWLPLLVLVGGIVACNVWVVTSTDDAIFESVDSIRSNTVGMVLGTSKKVAPNQPNLHFEHRLEAAAKLYHAGKVKHLLVSGDRDSEYYNEPRDMTKKLMELGVPSNAITADNAGYRTLDSVIRARRVFGLRRMTVISDDFHVARALFIANKEGIDAVALRSEPVELRLSFKARTREWLARVKAVLDLYILDTEPSLLGEPVEILVDSSATRDPVAAAR